MSGYRLISEGVMSASAQTGTSNSRGGRQQSAACPSRSHARRGPGQPALFGPTLPQTMLLADTTRTGSGSLPRNKEHGRTSHRNEIAKTRSATARTCIAPAICSNGSSTRASNVGVSRPIRRTGGQLLGLHRRASPIHPLRGLKDRSLSRHGHKRGLFIGWCE
jgi:hypothetical protein